MTHRDIYTKFMIEYDKANVTSSYPSLTPYEVATLLDKAYLALIARKITGNNPRRSQLESDIKSVSDLEPLITTTNCNLKLVGRNIVSYTLPEKFLYYVNSTMDYNNTENPYDDIRSRLLPITLTTHNVAEKFLATQYNMPWVKNPVCYLEDNTVYIVYDPIDKPSISGSAHLTYIKSPAKFAGSSTFDPSNPPTYEPDPIDDEEYEDPTDPTGGGQGQGLGQGQGGQLNPPAEDTFAISLSSLTKIEDNKYRCIATVTKNNVPVLNPVITWLIDGSGVSTINYILMLTDGTLCILTIKKQLPSGFILKATSNGKTAQQNVSSQVTYTSSQGGQDSSGVYRIEITDAQQDTHYGNNVYFAECTVYKDGNKYKDGVTYWSLVDSSLESKIQLEQNINGRTCYFDVKSQLSNYNVLVKVTINDISQTKTLRLSTQGSQTETTGESTITFDFQKPWNLNPSINVPHTPTGDVGSVGTTDTTFKNGSVSLSFATRSPGSEGSAITIHGAEAEGYQYFLYIGLFTNFTFKTASGSYFKSIKFEGAVGDITPSDTSGFSTVTNTWRYDSNSGQPKYLDTINFGNFVNPAYISKITIKVSGSTSNSGSGSTTYTNYDYTKLPPDAQTIDIDFTKPETLNFSPALTKSNDMWRATQVSDNGYIQYAGPNNIISIVYRPKSGDPGDGVLLYYTLQDGYYLWLKYWSGFVVTLNNSRYELYRILFNGKTTAFNNANGQEKTWYANLPGVRENEQLVGYSTAEMKKMTIIYRPTSNNDDYKWQYASYGTTYNGTVCPVFRKNYLSCGGTNFSLVDGTQYASIDSMGTIKIKSTPPYEFKFKVYCECEEDTSVNKTIEIPSYEITHASGGDPDPNVTPVEDPKDEFNIAISYDSNKSTDNIAVIHLVMDNPDNLTSVRTRLQFKKADTSFPKGWVWSDLTSDFYFGKPDEYDYELRKNINTGIRYNNELTVRASTLANNLPASGHYSNEITIPTTS